MITFRADFGDGWWWPNYDHKPEKCYSLVSRQLSDADVAASHAKHKRVCVQAGGHAGLWPLRLAKSFDHVYTFEPEPALFECLRRNVYGKDVAHKIHAVEAALGRRSCDVFMRPSVSAGSWRVDNAGTFKVKQVTIDGLELAQCDCILLDIEGYEVEALLGAVRTITRFSPMIYVEELPRSKNAIQDHLRGLGYLAVARAHNDVVYNRSWRQ